MKRPASPGRRQFLVFAGCLVAAAALFMYLRHEPEHEAPLPEVGPDGTSIETGAALATSTARARLAGRGERTPDVEADGARRAAWSVAGKVSREDGTPVEGAEFVVTLQRGATRAPEAVALSDQAGGYAAEVPALATMARVPRATARVLARATARGHQPSEVVEATLSLTEDAQEIRLDILLVPGVTLRGRFVDATGRPVPDAWVALHGPTEGGDHSDAQGRYVLGVTATGSHRLQASVAGVGTGSLEGLSLGIDADTDAPDLVLRGPGRIAGIVFDPDGRTAAGVTVYAFLAVAAGDGEADGVRFATVESDDAGRFVLAGLRPGRYVLGTWGRPAQANGTWPTGTEDARVVADRSTLRVRVVDAEGQPVPGASYTLQGKSENREFKRAGWVERADGVVALGAAPGAHVRFTACVEEDLRATVEVTLDERIGVTRVDAVLGAEAPPMGRLRVVIDGPDGHRLNAFTVSLRRADERMRMVDHSFLTPEDDEGRLPPVPPGRYVVEVRPGLAGLRDPPVALYFRHEAPAVVRADEETVLRVVARAGGRLRLTVHLPEARDADPVPKDSMTTSDLRAVAIALQGGRTSTLHSFVTYDEDRWTVISTLRTGVPNVTAPILAAGRYTVRVIATGHRPAEVVTDVAAGHITDVEVYLQAE